MAGSLKRLGLSIIAAAFVSAPALAAGLSVSPPFQEVSLAPGDVTTSFNVELANETAAPIKLRLSVIDFGSLDETGGLYFIGQTNDFERKYGLANWLKLEKDTLDLAPGTNAKVKVTVDNRSDLTPGGHYGAVLAKIDSTSGSGGPQIDLKTVVSSLVFLRKVGGERYDLKLESFDKPASWHNLPQLVRLRFSNPGNTHVRPRGTVKILDPEGKQVAQGTINEDSSLLLPETVRAYSVKLNKITAVGLAGRYKMVITYRYDGYDNYREVSVSFWLFDWASVGGLFAAALVIGLIVVLLFRRRRPGRRPS